MFTFLDSLASVDDVEAQCILTLPISHNCTIKDFEGILTKEAIECSMCNYFNEELVYFFYGRPVYYSDKKSWEEPIFLVFDLNVKINIKRIVPFDSGSFCCYQGECDEKENPLEKINDFSFSDENWLNTIKKLIIKLYGDNEKYYDGDIILPASIRDEYYNSKLDDYLKYIDEAGRKSIKGSAIPLDWRVATIEIQVSENFSLQSNELICVATPSKFKNYAKRFQQYGKDVTHIVYGNMLAASRQHLVGNIHGQVKTLLSLKNKLHGI